jgi:hypothetical protein
MYLFGFLGVFVLTQLHGVGLSTTARWYVTAVFAVGVLVVYSWRGFDRIDEVVRIPAVEYLLAAVVAPLIWIGIRLAAVLR